MSSYSNSEVKTGIGLNPVIVGHVKLNAMQCKSERSDKLENTKKLKLL